MKPFEFKSEYKHRIYSTLNKNQIQLMKILSTTTFLLVLLATQAVLAFHQSNANLALDFPQADIAGSASTTDGKIMAVLTKTSELRVYQLNKQSFVFVTGASTCQGQSVKISQEGINRKDGSQSSHLLITVKCENKELNYEFETTTKLLKQITVKRLIQDAIDSMRTIMPMRSTRLLQNGTNGTNVTNCTVKIVTANVTTCGDGNTVDGDGCSANCQLEYCGDAVTNNNGTEQCDDGNKVTGDGCNNCKLQCGDGLLNFGEQCDDGNTVNGDGCSATCKKENAAIALPLALGIPLVAVALIGLLVAKCIMAKSAAGAAYTVSQPGQIIEVEESTKVLRN